MIKIIFYTYIFIRWTGGWGVHTGIGAFCFGILWTAFMFLSISMGTFGPLLTVVSIGKLFKLNVNELRNGLIHMLHTPGGRMLLFGHIGTMAVTALICYFAYFLTGANLPACIVHWGEPFFFEWILLVWYGYSVYSFFKNMGGVGDMFS